MFSTLLMSCDPGLINNYVIENKSDFLVNVKFKLTEGHRKMQSTDTIQSKQIRPGETVEFIDYGEIGNAYDKQEQFLDAFETVTASINGVDLTEKISQRSNWHYKEIHKGLSKLDEVEYKLVIQNEDNIKVKR